MKKNLFSKQFSYSMRLLFIFSSQITEGEKEFSVVNIGIALFLKNLVFNVSRETKKIEIMKFLNSKRIFKDLM